MAYRDALRVLVESLKGGKWSVKVWEGSKCFPQMSGFATFADSSTRSAVSLCYSYSVWE